MSRSAEPRKFLVLCIDNNPEDTYAVEYHGRVGESMLAVLDAAQPAKDSTIDFTFVRAPNELEALKKLSASWQPVSPQWLHAWTQAIEARSPVASPPRARTLELAAEREHLRSDNQRLAAEVNQLAAEVNQLRARVEHLTGSPDSVGGHLSSTLDDAARRFALLELD